MQAMYKSLSEPYVFNHCNPHLQKKTLQYLHPNTSYYEKVVSIISNSDLDFDLIRPKYNTKLDRHASFLYPMVGLYSIVTNV